MAQYLKVLPFNANGRHFRRQGGSSASGPHPTIWTGTDLPGQFLLKE